MLEKQVCWLLTGVRFGSFRSLIFTIALYAYDGEACFFAPATPSVDHLSRPASGSLPRRWPARVT